MQYKRERCKSHSLLSYEALFRRLQVRYRNNDKVQVEYFKKRAGYYGEKNLDYKLSLFPQDDFLHFPDLRLHNHRNYFQIDSLLITPKVIFILEAKNLQGIVEYQAKSKQFIQIVYDRTTSFKDPLLQAETQKRHLSYWLAQQHIQIPIETLIVSTNQATIIRNIEGDAIFDHRFVTLENLLFKMEEIYQSYSKKVLSFREIQQIFQLLDTYQESAKSDLVKLYKIQSQHLVQGVFCDDCKNGILQKLRKSWRCMNCGVVSFDRHERVILDYFLLGENYITNKVCRELLQIKSRDVTYRLLDGMNLKVRGSKRKRKYLSPDLSQYPQNSEPEFVKQSIFDY